MTQGVENYSASAREHIDDFRKSPGIYIHQDIVASLIQCDLLKEEGRESFRNFVTQLRKNLHPQEHLLTMQGCDGLVYAKDVQPGDNIEPAGFRSDPLWIAQTGSLEPLLRQAMKGVRSVWKKDNTIAIPFVSNTEYEYFLYLAATISPNNSTKRISVKEFTTAMGKSVVFCLNKLSKLQAGLDQIPNMPLQIVNSRRQGYRLEPKSG